MYPGRKRCGAGMCLVVAQFPALMLRQRLSDGQGFQHVLREDGFAKDHLLW